MPTIEQNKSMWELEYNWSHGGDEWSKPWGGTHNVWEYVIFPRIAPFLSVRTIVEIAPGFGRWTQFLKHHCQRLIAVDLSSTCVDSCTRRFADSPHVVVVQNDGRSIPIAENASVDLVFSFDSLVHADAETLGVYLREIARVLAPQGAAFIHHSNLGQYRTVLALAGKLPRWALRTAHKAELLPSLHWRDASVTARWFASACRQSGLSAVRQELVNWLNRPMYLLDCFTTIGRSSVNARRVFHNRSFMSEAEQIRLSHPAGS
jgi:SAM-dependent methyltransferase